MKNRIVALLSSALLVSGLAMAAAPSAGASSRLASHDAWWSGHGEAWGWHHEEGRGDTTVALNGATISAVEGLGLTPAALFPGSLNAAVPSATFPIVGEVRNGMIAHSGGLSLSNGAKTLDLLNFIIDTNTNVLTAFASVNGAAVGRVALFDLGAAPAQLGCAATASLSLDAAAAGALTSVFGAPTLTGTNFGTACVVLPFERH